MIRIIEADITTLRVDAIVNAANEALLGGGGVDGAIHRAAGPRLLAACRALPEVHPRVRCPTGDARITDAFDLPARFVIHTVGPVWDGGGHGEAELLASCYRQVMSIARKQSVNSIAFPAISCGVFDYPPNLAAMIALGELAKAEHAKREIMICCRGSEILDSYRTAAANLGITPQW